MMELRTKSRLILAGLSTMIVVLTTGIEVHAGSAVVVTGGYKPGTGDPPYDYVFQAYLEPPPNPPGGANFLGYDDFFKVSGLPGVTSGSLSSQPSTDWSSDPSLGAMEWIYKGNTNITADSSTGLVYLGQFVVQTTEIFTSPPLAPGTITDYIFSYDGGTATGSGQFPMMNLSVPEPSSIVLLLTGLATIPVLRRRPAQRCRAVARIALPFRRRTA
jgi:hypothetical protein